MHETIQWLSGDFTVMDLGSANASDLAGLRPFRSILTLVEIDAMSQSTTNTIAGYRRKIALKTAISGQAGQRTFYKRKFPQSSSFLQFRPELAKAYGLQKFFEEAGSVELECETLSMLLNSLGLTQIDFLKTDLEGIDFEILTSAPEQVAHCLVIQSEARFQPLYIGEPDFYTLGSFLAGLGFELITLHPEVWKYTTAHRDLHRDGQTVWADAIFFLDQAHINQFFGPAAPQAFVKQIILATSLNLHNYAEYLYEKTAADLPASIQSELKAYLISTSNKQRALIRFSNDLMRIPGGSRILLFIRRVLLASVRVLSFDKRYRHILPPC